VDPGVHVADVVLAGDGHFVEGDRFLVDVLVGGYGGVEEVTSLSFSCRLSGLISLLTT
jgi:hypothetical protein